MKNILNIIRHDLKKISGSVVAIVTIMGLCLVPCSYAWFNILSNWAPYESEATGRISVAVANMDEGASAAGLKINVGEKIVEGLAANDDIGWVFLDSDKEAINGVYAGDYYAALVVPEDFTTHVLSFMSGDLTNPKLHYYENEKKNAIAPKITGKAKTAVQEQVNATFVETLAGYVSDAASIAEANGLDPQQMLDDLSERIEDLSGDLDDCIALTNSASGLTDAAGNLMEVSGGFMDSTHDVFASNDKLLQNLETELSKIKKTDTSKLEAAVEHGSHARCCRGVEKSQSFDCRQTFAVHKPLGARFGSEASERLVYHHLFKRFRLAELAYQSLLVYCHRALRQSGCIAQRKRSFCLVEDAIRLLRHRALRDYRHKYGKY